MEMIQRRSKRSLFARAARAAKLSAVVLKAKVQGSRARRRCRCRLQSGSGPNGHGPHPWRRRPVRRPRRMTDILPKSGKVTPPT